MKLTLRKDQNNWEDHGQFKDLPEAMNHLMIRGFDNFIKHIFSWSENETSFYIETFSNGKKLLFRLQ